MYDICYFKTFHIVFFSPLFLAFSVVFVSFRCSHWVLVCFISLYNEFKSHGNDLERIHRQTHTKNTKKNCIKCVFGFCLVWDMDLVGKNSKIMLKYIYDEKATFSEVMLWPGMGWITTEIVSESIENGEDCVHRRKMYLKCSFVHMSS